MYSYVCVFVLSCVYVIGNVRNWVRRQLEYFSVPSVKSVSYCINLLFFFCVYRKHLHLNLIIKQQVFFNCSWRGNLDSLFQEALQSMYQSWKGAFNDLSIDAYEAINFPAFSSMHEPEGLQGECC